MTDTDRDFVPALGKSGSLDRYDAAIAAARNPLLSLNDL
ncbi:hypothetical protein DFR51_3742 [Sphingosinicella microcystinivorans]|jgi:hypothetical protein|uniref:Uncharacterized protein n=1 Tax=Sphingosinicella microcystinivorans TaxID=335406 RepID=A0ABX9SUA1_SPHMI|nr:hypothetical protein DFR51_3742 [Sphingosinicella microcystinivorans]